MKTPRSVLAIGLGFGLCLVGMALVGIGLLADSDALVSWGEWLTAPWTYGMGALVALFLLCGLLSGLAAALGWAWRQVRALRALLAQR